MQEMFLSEKKLPEIISPFKDRDRFVMNTLSHMVLHSAGDNYKPLEDFPDIPPDNAEKRTPEDTSAALWNKTSPRGETKGKSKEGGFFDLSDDSDLQEFDSSDSGTDSSESGTDTDTDTDSGSDSESGTDSSDSGTDTDSEDSGSDSESGTDTDSEDSSEEQPKRKPKPVKRQAPRKKKPEPEPEPSSSESDSASESVSSSDIMAEPLFVPKKKEKSKSPGTKGGSDDDEDKPTKKRSKIKKVQTVGSSDDSDDESSSEEAVVAKKKGKKHKGKKGKKGKSKSPPKEPEPVKPAKKAEATDLLGDLFGDMNAKAKTETPPAVSTTKSTTTTAAAANTTDLLGDLFGGGGGSSAAAAPKTESKPAEEEKESSDDEDEEEEEEPKKSKKKGKKGKKGKKSKKNESSDEESEEEEKPKKKGKGKKSKKGKKGKSKKKEESSDESGWSDDDEEEEVVSSKKKKKSMSQPKNDEPEEKKADDTKAKAKQQRGDQLSDLFSSVMGPNVAVNPTNDIMGISGPGNIGGNDDNDILFGASVDSLMTKDANVGFRGELLNHTHTQGLQIDYEFMRQQSRYGVRFNQIRLIFENRWDKSMKGISLSPHNLDKSQQDYRDIFDGGIAELGPGEKKTDYIHVQFGKTSEMRFDINVQEGTNKNRHTAKIKGIPGELMRQNIGYSVEEFLKKKKASGAMSERNINCSLDTIDEAANSIIKTFNVGIINSGGNLDMSKERYFAGYLLSDDSDVLISLEASSSGKITCTINCTEFMLVDAITGVARQCLTKK
eukprot:CAMPEP_0201577864 /NCGR_PEP_ID=MMETSP0190_2-20130828/24429_1 /ASSEMBLY_ACC=CAM_ASM_000263 /TAXON_ID=37353 /ORGANISM="Rosalina sp." /LENGTH=776 /DNA_ID=CAMNT_0048010367 /DNA_START=364 /DNA_END=2697 /DNA_ORIENTATION=+